GIADIQRLLSVCSLAPGFHFDHSAKSIVLASIDLDSDSIRGDWNNCRKLSPDFVVIHNRGHCDPLRVVPELHVVGCDSIAICAERRVKLLWIDWSYQIRLP